MKFLIFLSLFLLINSRPQYYRSAIAYRAQDSVPFVESGLIQETRDRRQPHDTGEDHEHVQDHGVHGSNEEHEFHFSEMPMKSFVQLGPNEAEDKHPVAQ